MKTGTRRGKRTAVMITVGLSACAAAWCLLPEAAAGQTTPAKASDGISNRDQAEKTISSAAPNANARIPPQLEQIRARIQEAEGKLKQSTPSSNGAASNREDRNFVSELTKPGEDEQTEAMPPQSTSVPAMPLWQYGAFVDAAYLVDFNHPANDLFRSRGTAYKVDEPLINMAAAYLQKTTSESSPWGMQLTTQAGQDTRIFGYSSTAPNLPGSSWLRHLGPTNVSYLAPAGKGLTIQGGIFSSLIGYDSLYAKDNFNYTRPWGADFTPYLMLGINASYPFSDKLTVTGYVVNGYWHLANANSVPSWGAQLAYKATSRTTLKQTVLIGPHQSDTGLQFWRYLSDSIVERKTDRITSAFEYQVGTEAVATPASPRALWMAAQLPLHWVLNRHWSVTERPEVYWDRNGRLTGFVQTIKANTATLEYRRSYRQFIGIARMEYRVDDSRGPGGGFFRGAYISPGVVGLTPTQNVLGIAAILIFDSQAVP